MDNVTRTYLQEELEKSFGQLTNAMQHRAYKIEKEVLISLIEKVNSLKEELALYEA